MRICLVSSAYRPYISGVGEHVHYLGKELQKLGHSVHVLTTTYQTIRKTECHTTTRLGKGLLIPFAKGQFTLPIAANLALQAKKFFLSNRFDIVHCHGIFPPELAYWATRYSTAPVITTFHVVNPLLPKFTYSAFRALFKKLRYKLRAKIAVSRACQEWAVNFFPGHYWVIPNGVDFKFFHPNVNPALSVTQNHRLLFVGRLEKRKGLEYLLQALPAVLASYPETELVVVGFGPLKNYYQQLTVKLGISNSVRFVGAVPNDELAGYYTSATIYIAPTIGREAMGIVLIEAMACGLPVIASHITGYDEVIENGVNGILVPPGNSEKLGEKIIQLLGSKTTREKLAEQALLRSKDFEWSKIAREVEKVYLTVS